MSESQKEDPKVDKYLTDMKELPPSGKDVGKEVKTEKKAPPKENVIDKMKSSNNTAKIEELPQKVEKPSKKKTPDKDVMSDSNSRFTFKDIILGIINFISIILLIYLLTRLPIKAKEFQDERVKELQNQTDPVSVFGDISQEKQKADELDNLFLDDLQIAHPNS